MAENFLSSEDLFADLDAPLEGTYRILYPKSGSVKYRAIQSSEEWTKVLQETLRLMKLKQNISPQLDPILSAASESDITDAVHLLCCLVQPKLKDIHEALKVCKKLGPQASLLRIEIQKLSGIIQSQSEEELQEEEDALVKDPFPAEDDGPVSALPEEASV